MSRPHGTPGQMDEIPRDKPPRCEPLTAPDVTGVGTLWHLYTLMSCPPWWASSPAGPPVPPRTMGCPRASGAPPAGSHGDPGGLYILYTSKIHPGYHSRTPPGYGFGLPPELGADLTSVTTPVTTTIRCRSIAGSAARGSGYPPPLGADLTSVSLGYPPPLGAYLSRGPWPGVPWG